MFRELSKSFAILLATGVAFPLLESAFPAYCQNATGGEFNETISIGAPGPSFDSLASTNGKAFNAKSLEDAEIVVVAFTCITCPYALDYESRLIELAKRYQVEKKSVVFLAINSNDIPGDSLELMKARAQEQKYPFEYLKDSEQIVAKELGASKTPEFFVLDRDRKVVYMGAFDDNTDESKATKQYLKEAVDAVLAKGEIELKETAPVGCRIRAKRERR